jgi:hypothetical protein
VRKRHDKHPTAAANEQGKTQCSWAEIVPALATPREGTG